MICASLMSISPGWREARTARGAAIRPGAIESKECTKPQGAPTTRGRAATSARRRQVSLARRGRSISQPPSRDRLWTLLRFAPALRVTTPARCGFFAIKNFGDETVGTRRFFTKVLDRQLA